MGGEGWRVQRDPREDPIGGEGRGILVPEGGGGLPSVGH